MNAAATILALGVLAFGLVSLRAQRSVITAPIAFVLLGLLASEWWLGLVPPAIETGAVHGIAEVALALVLFTDAARIDLGLLVREHRLPLRLLGIGLPLTILAGTLGALVLLPELGPWEAAALAAILAPTDAALGQAVVREPRVPVRVRQALSVESGLNDGVCLPVFMVLLCAARVAGHEHPDWQHWVQLTALQILLAPAIGIAAGWAGGKLITAADGAGLMSRSFEQLSSVALALAVLGIAEMSGANGFIAAFSAGLAFGRATPPTAERLREFAEAEGQLLALIVFAALGALLLPAAIGAATRAEVLYAVASLTAIRLLPVAISLIGARVRRDTVAFLGWFGPRGIASLVFALVILEAYDVAGHERIVRVTTLTVALSVLAHGVTAWPAARWYGGRLACQDGRSREHEPMTEMPFWGSCPPTTGPDDRASPGPTR